MLLWALFKCFNRTIARMLTDGVIKKSNSVKNLLGAFSKALAVIIGGGQGKYKNLLDNVAAFLSVLIMFCASTIVLVSFIIFLATNHNEIFALGSTPQPVFTPEKSIIVEPDAPTSMFYPPIFARDLQTVNTPETYHVNGWKANSYSGDFYLNNKKYSEGVGIFLQSRDLKNNEVGTCEITYKTLDHYTHFSFELGSDSKWGNGSKAGVFCVSVWGDYTNELYNSDWQDHLFYDHVEVIVKAYDTVTLRLEEKRGEKGTLNIVFGNLMMSSNTTQQF
jgi:hypothetical protein